MLCGVWTTNIYLSRCVPSLSEAPGPRMGQNASRVTYISRPYPPYVYYYQLLYNMCPENHFRALILNGEFGGAVTTINSKETSQFVIPGMLPISLSKSTTTRTCQKYIIYRLSSCMGTSHHFRFCLCSILN